MKLFTIAGLFGTLYALRLGTERGKEWIDEYTMAAEKFPDEHPWAARCERARRCIQAGNHDLRGYPALHADEETADTLAAAPAEKAEKKSKVQQGPPA